MVLKGLICCQGIARQLIPPNYSAKQIVHSFTIVIVIFMAQVGKI